MNLNRSAIYKELRRKRIEEGIREVVLTYDWLIVLAAFVGLVIVEAMDYAVG